MIRGKVVKGKQLGRTIGFPTANLDVVCGDVPAVGVYVVRVCFKSDAYKDEQRGERQNGQDGQDGRLGVWYEGMMNIGVSSEVIGGEQNGSFKHNESARQVFAVEVHIFDFKADIYGKDLEVEVIGFLRDEIKFSSLEMPLEMLKVQLQLDKQAALQVLNGALNPAYILEQEHLENNLRRIDQVRRVAGVEILVALKAFAMWRAFPIFKHYGFNVSTASSPCEARLAYEEFGVRAHAFSPCYTDENIDEFLEYCSSITFNSLSQFERFKDRVERAHTAHTVAHAGQQRMVAGESTQDVIAGGSTRGIMASVNAQKVMAESETQNVGKISMGLRVNPEYSEVATDLYNPTGIGSRLGIKAEELQQQLQGTLPPQIEGLHCHTLCESSAEASAKLIEAFENKFKHYLPKLKWVNFGGGHLITRKEYNTETLVKALKDFKHKYPHLKIYLEPGSAFTWQTGILKARIEDIVESDRIKTAILNISFSCHLPDCLEMPYMPEVRGAKIVEKDMVAPKVYRLGGNSCLAGDFMGSWQFDHELQINEEIIFEDMIHYTMVKTTTFNGLQHPSIMITKNGVPIYFRKFTYGDYKPRLS